MKKLPASTYENANATEFIFTYSRPPQINEMMELLRNRAYANNIKRFKKLWGEQAFCWTGFQRNWVWIHTLQTCTLFVLTSTAGTSYEYALLPDTVSSKIPTEKLREQCSLEVLDFIRELP